MPTCWRSSRAAAQLAESGDIERLDVGTTAPFLIGTAAELATMRRLFAVMGMEPIGLLRPVCSRGAGAFDGARR
jgi:uncharacterized glyoxalase superfamily metalloenzyme YdcJ